MAPTANGLFVTGLLGAGVATIMRKRTVDSSQVSLLHAPATAQVADTGKTLGELINDKCPSLADPVLGRFVPSLLLPGADLQTCLNSVREQMGKRDAVQYERELITTEDGGTIGLDWSPPFSQLPEDDNRPIVVISHGLSGGSRETYVQDTVKHLTGEQYKFRTVVVNFRGCAGVKLTTPSLYNAGLTTDYGFAIGHIRNRLPQAKLISIGFSLGANLITKYVGEQGKDCPLLGAVSVCNPYDLAASSDAIEEPSFRNKYIYTPAMLLGLMRIYKRHRKMLETGSIVLDNEAISKITMIRQFDDLITSRLFGYKDSTDYYLKNSSSQFMSQIEVPFLAISALDDPVCPESAIPRDVFRSNPHLVLAQTQYGGHLGYHEDLNSTWFPRPIAEFCDAIFSSHIA